MKEETTMSDIVQLVKNRDPDQPEFHQAVTEVVESIDHVTGEDVIRLAGEIFSGQDLTIVGLGPLEDVGIDWKS